MCALGVPAQFLSVLVYSVALALKLVEVFSCWLKFQKTQLSFCIITWFIREEITVVKSL